MTLVSVQICLVLKDGTAMRVATGIESMICTSVVVRHEVALTVIADVVVVEVALTVTADVVLIEVTLTVTADVMVKVVVKADVVVANLVLSVVGIALTGGGTMPISYSDTCKQQQNTVIPAT